MLENVPRPITPEQYESLMKIVADILKNIENVTNFLENVILDKWFFQYNTGTKRQSMHWKTPSSTRWKKVWMSKSKFKTKIFLSQFPKLFPKIAFLWFLVQHREQNCLLFHFDLYLYFKFYNYRHVTGFSTKEYVKLGIYRLYRTEDPKCCGIGYLCA